MATKAFRAKSKAGEDRGLGAGEFEALVSVFGTVDSVGDRVMPGAFGKTLADWEERGKPIPVIFTHSHANAFDYIGDVLEAKETDEGLWVKGVLDIKEEDENPTARQVYRLLKGGRIDNWSFAYDVVDAAPAKSDDGDDADGVTELHELKLYEVGPTLIGAHQGTRTLAVKQRFKATVSDKPWSDFSQADYTDQQWARACILDRGEGEGKSRYALPVREPEGALNRNGCHAAASVLGGGRGGVDATAEQKATAARKLVSLYRNQLDEEPPDSLVDAAKSRTTQAKAGRTLSKQNEDALRQAASLISDVLASIDGEAPQESAQPTTPAKDETASGKSQEPKSLSPVDLLTYIEIHEQE